MNYHLGLSVLGAIRNAAWRGSLVGACRDPETGRKLTAHEILDELCRHLALGHKVIPYSQCDNWCWTNGCQGH